MNLLQNTGPLSVKKKQSHIKFTILIPKWLRVTRVDILTNILDSKKKKNAYVSVVGWCTLCCNFQRDSPVIFGL